METREALIDKVAAGDCLDVLPRLPRGSVDFVLTDPPYLSSYRPRDGRTVTNDDNGAWLEPALQELFRVLKQDAFCLTFYGWPFADRFVSAFRKAGFRPVSHLAFMKKYASYTGYTKAHHEVAYLLAKGVPPKPANPIPDILRWEYTGNKIHPTQKPVSVLLPLVKTFSAPGDVVLDPFCGSGSSLVAAKTAGRHFIGIEIERAYADAATLRLEKNGGE